MGCGSGGCGGLRFSIRRVRRHRRAVQGREPPERVLQLVPGQPGRALVGTLLAVAFMAGSGFCLFLAQKTIPMGTAYAVWTGIGAAGAFLVGVAFFGDASTFGRWLGAFLIISGVVVMKLSS